jgi:hypothetical protein
MSPSVRDTPHPASETRPAPDMSDELIELLRQRVATRFYDQPRIVDALARRLLRLGSS